MADREKDDSLVLRAERGQVGQGAVVEAMLRLRDAIGELNKSTTELGKKTLFLNWLLLWVGVAATVLTIVQVLIAFKVIGGAP